MVFQKPTPFPMTIYDNIAFGVKLHERLSRVGDGRTGGMVADPRGAVGRGEGPAEHLGDGPVRRPAAAAVHRAHHRRAARR